MNYRHAYHAGNFADVFKHFLLSRVIEHLKKKDKGFRVIDTHSGSGSYKLPPKDQLSANGKPPEWVDGIGRLTGAIFSEHAQTVLDPYLHTVFGHQRELMPGTYPGSPMLAFNQLRKQDRLSACELHPEAFAELQSFLGGNYQVRLLNLDGWLIPNSQIPPKEKRGLTLIDPPFEQKGDFERMVDALVLASKRWSGGTIMLWYPIKHQHQVSRFHDLLLQSKVRNLWRYEVMIDEPLHPDTGQAHLYGCGMIVRNPPFTLADEVRTVLPEFVRVLEKRNGVGGWSCDQLTDE